MKCTHACLIPAITLAIINPFAVHAAFQVDPEFQAQVSGTVHTISLTPDGRIAVGGEFDQVNDVTRRNLAQLNSNGTLVPSFDIETDGAIFCIAAGADGALTVGGAFNQPARHLLRLSPSGELDSTLNLGSSTSSRIQCIDIAQDGSVFFGGPFRRLNGVDAVYAGKISAGGTVDTSFNSGLAVSFAMEAAVNCVAALPGGKKVLAAGYFNTADASASLVRLNADGSIDSTFSGDHGPMLYPKAILVLADGRFLVGGTASSAGDGFVRRLHADGSVDPSFQPPAFSGSVECLALDSEGNLFVGGNFAGGLAFLNPDGSPDETWGISADNGVNALAIASDGSVLVGGAFRKIGDATQSGIARLKKRVGQHAFATNSNAGFIARIPGELGKTYEIEASADLQTWSAIGSKVASLNGVEIQDAGAATRKHRFFRAKLSR